MVAKDVEVLSESAPLPFQIDEHVEVGEEVRLKHRYLDLRRTAPGNAIRLRSDVNKAARGVLAKYSVQSTSSCPNRRSGLSDPKRAIASA